MKKICSIIVAMIIIVGILIISAKGLNFDLKYRENKSIEFNIEKEFNEEDIRNITNEVLGEQEVIIQAIEVYKDAVKITTTEITEEQKNEIITKVNEKYGTELDASSITIQENANIKGRSIINQYVIPFGAVTILILIYQMIRFAKLNSFSVALKTICTIVASELLLISIFAIGRIPVGEYITSLILVVYILSVGVVNTNFEKELEKKKEEEK